MKVKMFKTSRLEVSSKYLCYAAKEAMLCIALGSKTITLGTRSILSRKYVSRNDRLN